MKAGLPARSSAARLRGRAPPSPVPPPPARLAPLARARRALRAGLPRAPPLRACGSGLCPPPRPFPLHASLRSPAPLPTARLASLARTRRALRAGFARLRARMRGRAAPSPAPPPSRGRGARARPPRAGGPPAPDAHGAPASRASARDCGGGLRPPPLPPFAGSLRSPAPDAHCAPHSRASARDCGGGLRPPPPPSHAGSLRSPAPDAHCAPASHYLTTISGASCASESGCNASVGTR